MYRAGDFLKSLVSAQGRGGDVRLLSGDLLRNPYEKKLGRDLCQQSLASQNHTAARIISRNPEMQRGRMTDVLHRVVPEGGMVGCHVRPADVMRE